ncbi:hypothetical protein [Paenibacillus sp. S150]|uniref:hypothetical protein n=1 Tax=Paenibacillus sp. S150 TaxID=2749826 RepID=UPI001C5855C1|nr:hypothetical protein [Paenibacillus sp. S150]MBW4084460.1 hypothetical protein [Paenibacillus sp. S150]
MVITSPKRLGYARFLQDNPEALDWTIQSLVLAHQSRHDGDFKRCLALFETLREGVTEEQARRYHEVLTECLGQVVLKIPELAQACG